MNLQKKRALVIANVLTLSRLPLALLFAFFCGQEQNSLISCSLIFLTVVTTDLLDGKIARKYEVISDIGAKLDVWCDFCFIITASVALCLLGKMSFLLPLIIGAKFLEFLLTSHWSKKWEARQHSLVFDPCGRILALFFYALPLIALAGDDLYLQAETGLIIIIALAALLSSFLRLRYCLLRREEKVV